LTTTGGVDWFKRAWKKSPGGVGGGNQKDESGQVGEFRDLGPTVSLKRGRKFSIRGLAPGDVSIDYLWGGWQ